MMSSTRSTSLPPSINFGVASRARLSTCSKKLLELLDCQTGIADNCSHRVGIDRIIARHDNPDRTLRHENVFALSIDVKAGCLQGFDGAQMIYAGKLRHQSGRDDFHLANFTPRFRFSVEIYVTANRILDIFQRLIDCSALRVTSREFRTAHRYAFVVFNQSDVKFSLHGNERTPCTRERQWWYATVRNANIRAINPPA